MDIYATKRLIGGHGGNVFHCVGGNHGKVLEKIGVWAAPDSLQAIKVWLSDDTPKIYGHGYGDYKEFSFEIGERITELSLWGNGAGTRCGAIHFKTNKNRVFDHQMTSWPLKKKYSVNIGSGICVGVVGRAGNAIDQLGFVFLNPIEYTKLTKIHYPTLAQDSRSIPPITLDSFSDDNPANNKTNTSWNFNGSQSVTTSSTWSITVGVEFTETTTVEAQIPTLGKIGNTVGVKLSTTGSFSKTNSETRTLSWSKSGTLKPGESISIEAVTRKGNLTFPFEGTMFVKLKNGRTFTYPVQGIYSGVTYTGVELSTVA